MARTWSLGQPVRGAGKGTRHLGRAARPLAPAGAARTLARLVVLGPRPKLRPVRQVILALNWDFAVVAGWRSGYFEVSGIGTPRSSKACRWAGVGSASIAMVTSVPAYRTWLRVKVARCSSRPRKL